MQNDSFKSRFSEKHLNEITKWFIKSSRRLSENQNNQVDIVTIDQLMEYLGERMCSIQNHFSIHALVNASLSYIFHEREFHYPSYGEVMTQAEKLKVHVSRVLTKEQVLLILDNWIIDPNLKHELKLAFKVFDSENRSFLDIDEIQVLVTAYGIPFDDNETLEFLRDANVRGDGNVFYDDFVESLFNLAPELNEIKAEYLYEKPEDDPSFIQ